MSYAVTGYELGAALLVGLVGSGHCLVMCGGVAGALELAIRPGTGGARAACRAGYQAGRIAGYGIAGAMAGGAGAVLLGLASADTAVRLARGLQVAVLLLLGLYLAGIWRGPLAALERAGARVWQALAPLRRRVLPVRGPAGALRMGLLWGFLPCGFVYSAIALAMATGGAAQGASVMLAFGLGTLPAVLLAAGAAGRVARLDRQHGMRRVAGFLLIAGGLALGLHA